MSQENAQTLGKGRTEDQGFAIVHSLLRERREMRKDRRRKRRESGTEREKDRKAEEAESGIQEYSGYQRNGSQTILLYFPDRQSNIIYLSSKQTSLHFYLSRLRDILNTCFDLSGGAQKPDLRLQKAYSSQH